MVEHRHQRANPRIQDDIYKYVSIELFMLYAVCIHSVWEQRKKELTAKGTTRAYIF